MKRQWKKIKRALRRPFETAGFLLLKWMIPLWPRGFVVHLSKAVGRAGAYLPSRETRIAMINLDAVFGGTKTKAEKRAILGTSFATFTQTMIDVLWFGKDSDQRIRKYVSFEKSPLADTFFADKPMMCITAHMGSWEIMGQAAALQGVDLASIAAPIKNPLVDKMIVKRREQTGQTIIPRKGALRILISRFRKNGKAAFVLDQNTDTADGGIPIKLLGFPMTVSSAPAAMAYRTGTEILIGFCLPQPGGRYRIHIPERIVPPAFDKELDMDSVVQELTQKIEDALSAEIRKYPEYWLWSYKHWRRHPGITYPPNHPEY